MREYVVLRDALTITELTGDVTASDGRTDSSDGSWDKYRELINRPVAMRRATLPRSNDW
jgi:hypothetical protein